MTRKKTEKKDENQNVIRVDRYSSTLLCNLTDDEVAERADDAARLVEKKDLKQAEFDQLRKHCKNEIELIEVQLRVASSEVRERKTSREVQCERRYDYTRGKVFEVRLDTREIISERDMSAAEKQRELEFSSQDLDEEFEAAEEE